MDHRSAATNQDGKKDKTKINSPVLPPLKSGKNVSSLMMESGPEYRSMVTQPISGVSGFASMSTGLKTYSSGAGVTFKELGLLSKDFGFPKDGSTVEIEDRKPTGMPTGMPAGSYHREPFSSMPSSSIGEPGHGTPPPDYKPLLPKKCWVEPKLRLIPKYYPLERSNRILDEHEHNLKDILTNLSDCFRVMGFQAKYLENPAGAALLTPEQVEIYLYLWKTGHGKQYCIEVQRRRGDSVIFHRYARHILEAASGDFDVTEFKDFTDSNYLKAAEKLLRNDFVKNINEREESLTSIEMAAGLIKKDRFDARLLGMESLCILTDPRKTNLNTALLASRAVLFGVVKEEEGNQSFREIHEFVLNVVQKRCMGDEDSFLQDMVVEYDSDDEDMFDDEEVRDEAKPPEYYDSMKTFVNYGLTILANSWEVVSTFESFESEPESTGASYSVDSAVAEFHRTAYNLTHVDIVTSLLMELGRAESKAHNACLAAKCLRILCQSSDNARDRTKSLYGMESASRAEQIGNATNARLERESAQLLRALRS